MLTSWSHSEEVLVLLSRSSQQRDGGFTHRWCPSVCPFVCLSVAKMQKHDFFQKVSNLELCFLLTTYRKSYMGFSKNLLLNPKIQDGGDPPSWILTPKCKKTRFSQKLSNLELRCLLTTYRKLCNWAFERTHYWIPIQSKMAEILHLENTPSPHSISRHFYIKWRQCHVNHKQLLAEDQKIIPTSLSHGNRGFIWST